MIDCKTSSHVSIADASPLNFGQLSNEIVKIQLLTDLRPSATVKNQPNDTGLCVQCGLNPIKVKNKGLCKRCYNKHRNQLRDKKKWNRWYADYRREKPEKQLYQAAKSKAKREGRAFDLDEAWVKELLEKGACQVSGVPFQLPEYVEGNRSKNNPFSPSIDRIDNAKGYTKDNCQVILWSINLFKNNFNEKVVFEIAKAWVNQDKKER